jgi:hypothetical protein
MAGTTDPDKLALLAEIAATRVELRDASEHLRAAMDVPSRVRRSVQQHRARWIGGATAAALLLVVLRRRKKVVYVERSTGDFLGAAGKAGMVLTGLKLVLSLAKPVLGELAKTRLADLTARFTQSRAARSAEPRRHT